MDEERLYTGFCAQSAELADMLAAAVQRENVAAAATRAHPGMAQESACDVILPCHPGATDEEVNHAILAAAKIAHVYFCAQPLS